MGGGKGGGSTVVGYRYFIGFHMAFCHGPIDAIREVHVSDSVAWPTGNDVPAPAYDEQQERIGVALADWTHGRPPGTPIPNQGVVTGIVTESSTIYINNADLFGGEGREGGVSGFVNFHMGTQTEPRDPYLIEKLGPQVPAFRGVVTGVVRQAYVAAMNPYIKPWSIYASRTQAQTDGSPQWYPSKATIATYDMNPAHMLRECLTNTVWGRGRAASEIDDLAFTAAADRLYAESFGLSYVWADTRDVDSFVQLICAHIDASVFQDRVTNKWRIKLARDDYDAESLPTFGEDDILSIGELGRPFPTELVNQVTLTYWNRATRKNDTIVVDNQPLQDSIGGQINPNDVDRTGISSTSLAQRVAARELRSLGTSLLTGTFTATRKGLILSQGDVFKLSIPSRDIASVICRVTNIDFGTTAAAGIVIAFVQDVFGLPAQSYIGENPSRWVDPRVLPAPSPYRILSELPYYTILRELGPDAYATLAPTSGLIGLSGSRQTQATYSMNAWLSKGASPWSDQGAFPAAASARVPIATIREETSTVILDDIVDSSEIYYGRYASWDSELVLVLDFVIATRALTIARGVLDTVPIAHTANSRILFIDGHQFIGLEEQLVGETIAAKIVTRTSLGELLLANAPVNTVTIQGRHIRPYAPGQFRVNGAVYPPTSYGAPMGLSWRHRSRVQQTAYIVQQGENNIGPEAGTTYRVRVYRTSDNALMRDVDVGTVTDYDYTAAMAIADGVVQDIRFEVTAVRDGYNSWQSQSHALSRHGLGFQLGLELGGVPA